MLDKDPITIDLKGKTQPGKDEDILEWLEKNGFGDQVKSFHSRHLLFGLTSDICFFVHEALSAMKRMKSVVALHLLRKPFVESVLILEQLLIDEEEFLKKYYQGSDAFDPMKIPDEEKKKIIECAIPNIFPSRLFSSELIFNFRHNKKSTSSIYSVANQATHLVTTRNPVYITQSRTLNLLSATDKEIESQVDYFYFSLPVLLLYTVGLIEEMMRRRKIIDEPEVNFRRLIRLLGYMFLGLTENEKDSDIISKLSGKIELKCLACKEVNVLFQLDLYNLYKDENISCKYCLSDLITSFEDIEPFKDILSAVHKRTN